MGKLEKRHEAAILRLRFTKADCEYHQMVAEITGPEFDRDFLEWCAQNDIITAQQQAEQQAKISPVSEEQAKENFIPDSEEAEESTKKRKNISVMKIFKKIAAKIHPDKLTNASQERQESMGELYTLATKAMEENDWYSLYVIAMDLDIRVPKMTKEQINVIEKKAKEYETKTKKYKNSFAFVYDDVESPEEKEKLFRSYAQKTGCATRAGFEEQFKEEPN
jgi:hypothetical protein